MIHPYAYVSACNFLEFIPADLALFVSSPAGRKPLPLFYHTTASGPLDAPAVTDPTALFGGYLACGHFLRLMLEIGTEKYAGSADRLSMPAFQQSGRTFPPVMLYQRQRLGALGPMSPELVRMGLPRARSAVDRLLCRYKRLEELC